MLDENAKASSRLVLQLIKDIRDDVQLLKVEEVHHAEDLHIFAEGLCRKFEENLEPHIGRYSTSIKRMTMNIVNRYLDAVKQHEAGRSVGKISDEITTSINELDKLFELSLNMTIKDDALIN